MAIVSFGHLVRHAALHRYALNIVPIETSTALETALEAGHAQRAPLVLAPVVSSKIPGVDKASFAACEAAARDAHVPVSLIALKAGAEADLITAINLGCSGVCIQPSTAHFPQMVTEVKALADIARPCGITIGAVLPNHLDETLPDPRPATAECIALAARAALDFLDVDICGDDDNGKRRAKLDYARLRRIHEGTSIPLSARVAVEVQPDQVDKLIDSGLNLVHHGTFSIGKEFLAQELRLWGSAGRAVEILAQCPQLHPVAHVVEFNAPVDDLPRLNAFLREGRRRLAAIPGVRAVATGEAIADASRYRYCWLVIFANENVVESFRHHPLNVNFSDNMLFSIPDDQLTIDFRLTTE